MCILFIYIHSQTNHFIAIGPSAPAIWVQLIWSLLAHLNMDSIVHVYNLRGFSQPRSTGLLVWALLSHHTQQGFVLQYNMSFTSTSFYGILLNDDFTLSYMDAINESPDPCSQTEGSWKEPQLSSCLCWWNPQQHSVQVLLTTCIIPLRGKRVIMMPNLQQPWMMLRTRDVMSHRA